MNLASTTSIITPSSSWKMWHDAFATTFVPRKALQHAVAPKGQRTNGLIMRPVNNLLVLPLTSNIRHPGHLQEHRQKDDTQNDVK